MCKSNTIITKGKKLNTNCPLPMSEESILLILSSGYQITAQAAFIVELSNDDHEIMIDAMFGISVKQNGAIRIIFPKDNISDENILHILHCMQVIDLKTVIRKYATSTRPGGNAGVFSHLKPAQA